MLGIPALKPSQEQYCFLLGFFSFHDNELFFNDDNNIRSSMIFLDSIKDNQILAIFYHMIDR